VGHWNDNVGKGNRERGLLCLVGTRGADAITIFSKKVNLPTENRRKEEAYEGKALEDAGFKKKPKKTQGIGRILQPGGKK